MDFENIKITDRARNYHRRLFLEAWYSQRDPNSWNDHVNIPDIYASLHYYLLSSRTLAYFDNFWTFIHVILVHFTQADEDIRSKRLPIVLTKHSFLRF